MLALAGVVGGAVLADRDPRLERALGVQADEFPFEESALSGFGLARRFQRGGFGLANDADFQPRVHESSRVHVEPRHGDGGGEEVSALVREDVQHLARDVRVLAVEVELVPDLDEEHHPGVFGFNRTTWSSKGVSFCAGGSLGSHPARTAAEGPRPRVVAGARRRGGERARAGELRDERVVARGRGRGWRDDARARRTRPRRRRRGGGRGRGDARVAARGGGRGGGRGGAVGRLAPLAAGAGGVAASGAADRGAGGEADAPAPDPPRSASSPETPSGAPSAGFLKKKDVIGFDADFFPALPPGDLPDANRFIPPGPRGREAARAGSAGETRRGEDLSPRSK